MFFDSLIRMLSSNIPKRGFSSFALNIPDLVIGMCTFAVGEASSPLARVYALVVPLHLALALTHVLAELAFVEVAIRPFELSVAVFAIGTVVAFVFVAALAGP